MSEPTVGLQPFQSIYSAAVRRKGGKSALERLLPRTRPADEIANAPDSRILATMTKVINRVQFNWEVVEKKWPQIEGAFLRFDTSRLSMLSDEEWDHYLSDAKVIRSAAKIRATRENVRFVRSIAERHSSFGKFLAGWPADDQIGLMTFLKKHGSRLGGLSGQWVLRMIGWDAFILSPDVVSALRGAGCEIPNQPSAKRDLARVQATFNAWRIETGLPYAHLSRIAACSNGMNVDNGYLIDQTRQFLEMPT